MEEKVLEGRFQMLPACNVMYDVILTRQNIMLKEHVQNNKAQKRFLSILIENVIGNKMFESKISEDPSCYFQVIVLRKNKKGIRQKQTFTFRIKESDDKQENRTIGETWVRTVAWLTRDSETTVEALEAKEDFPARKKFFVLINPKSGPGKSLKIFKEIVEPLFQDANIKYETLITEYAGHCTEFIKTFDYTQWDVVVICSGDGLAYEYINGIMQRADWEAALKLPISILPTGSGNALSTSIMFAAKEVIALQNAIFITLKGNSHPMDVFSVVTQKQKVFGFLSLTWGIISDVDIESEKYRALGGLRFIIGAVQRIISLRHYKGMFSYLPGTKDEIIEKGAEELSMSNASSSTHEEESVNITNSDPEDYNCDIPESVNKTLKEARLTTDNRQTFSLATSDIETVKMHRAQSVPASMMVNRGVNHSSKENVLYGPVMTLPSFNEALPSNWISVEDEFVTIGLMSLSHLATDMHTAPGAFFNDGVLYSQLIRKGITKGQMVKVFTAYENGGHVKFPEVECETISAFRLVPGMERIGYIAVDGEVIDYGPVQGEVHPSLANVVMINR